MSACDHAAGRCADTAHQGLGGEADRDWFAAKRRHIADAAHLAGQNATNEWDEES